MAWDNIHDDDFGWVGKLRIVQDEVAVDISSYTTLRFIFRKPDGTEITKSVAFDTDGTDGYLAYTVEDGLIDTAGRWRVWAQVLKTGVELTSGTVRFDVFSRGSG